MSTTEGAPKKHDEQWWRTLIGQQAKTGERVVEICAQEGVTVQAFYWQRKRLIREKAAKFTEIELGVINECEIRCRNGRSVVVRGAVNPTHLKNVLSVAEGVQG